MSENEWAWSACARKWPALIERVVVYAGIADTTAAVPKVDGS
jgi:hypothetical protein